MKAPKEKVFAGGLNSLYEWVEAAVVSLVAVAILFCLFFRVVGVDGESMQNTLMHLDRLLLTSGYTEAAYGDIVVISRGSSEPLIKRVIAKGGDTVKIEDETVYLQKAGETDYVMLEEAYVFLDPFGGYIVDVMDPVVVPEGHVFVMGDNRRNSHDSRAADIGCVDMEDVIGKAFWRIWPLTAFGDIE
ncbi:MAG: signal peptidase I [Clostridia bacterium]|nr:signal peptidase I [Clostridia bacterium]